MDVRQSLRIRQGKIRELIAALVVDELVRFRRRDVGPTRRWLVEEAPVPISPGVEALLEELDELEDKVREIDDAERRLFSANERAERALRERMATASKEN